MCQRKFTEMSSQIYLKEKERNLRAIPLMILPEYSLSKANFALAKTTTVQND